MDNCFSKYLFLAVVCSLSLAGCSADTNRYFSGGSPQVAAPPDNVSAMLAQAADRASVALESLAAVEAHKTPLPSSTAPIANVPHGLSRAITVQWTGPVEPVVKMLASHAGYKFNTIGSPPPNDLIVNVDAENTEVIEILRSIGLQMGSRANIQVNGEQEIVEIAYASVAP